MAIKYGPSSMANIGELHPELQGLLHAYAEEAPDYLDISVTCGHRGKADQDTAVAEGASKAPWPTSAHNRIPSDAFDYACYGKDAAGNKVQLYDVEEMLLRQGAIRMLAHRYGIKLRPLIDWDKPHVERAKVAK